MNYDVNIPGMMSETELKILSTISSFVPNYGNILEIGIYLGRTTTALYKGKDNSVSLTSVDSWKYLPILMPDLHLQGDPKIFIEASKLSRKQGSMKAGFEYCVGNIVDNINVISEDSKNFVPDKEYDFVFIDGDHDYEGVSSDIQKYSTFTNLVMGDDYLSKFPGVVKACAEGSRNFSKTLIVSGSPDIKLWALVPRHGYWNSRSLDIFKLLTLMY